MGSPWPRNQLSWDLCWVAGDFHINFLHVSLKSPVPCLAEPWAHWSWRCRDLLS